MSGHAFLFGGGTDCLAAAAFMIRDGGVPGVNITILRAPCWVSVSMALETRQADTRCAAAAC